MSGRSLGMEIANFPKLADFKAFVTGTNKPYDNTVVRLSLNGGAEHKLCTTHWDFVGNFLRGQKTQKLNNDVRYAFAEAVYEYFGGPQNVPDSVTLAMKLEDYGTGNTLSGKPLTARRIRATLAAIRPYDLARDTGLSLKVVSNPVVSKRLGEHPELKAKIKGLLDSLPDAKSRKTVKTYIGFVLSNPKSMMPLPFDKQILDDDPKINKAFEDSLNEFFDLSVQNKNNPESKYSPDELLTQATKDIYRTIEITTEITTGEGEKKDKVWNSQISQNKKDSPIKSASDKEGCKNLLMGKVFKGNEKDTLDSLVIFNQGVEEFSIRPLPLLMGLGKEGTMLLPRHDWRHYDITSNNGGYHVKANLPYAPWSLESRLPGKSDSVTLPLSSEESSLNFTAEFDLYRDKSGNFRARNMHTTVVSDLRLSKDPAQWRFL